MLVETKTLTVPELYEIEVELNVAPRSIDFARDRVGGYKQLTFPDDFHDMKVLIVAYTGSDNDWAAYTGQPTNSHSLIEHMLFNQDMTDQTTVMDYGLKLNPITAKHLFPSFVEKGLEYRD